MPARPKALAVIAASAALLAMRAVAPAISALTPADTVALKTPDIAPLSAPRPADMAQPLKKTAQSDSFRFLYEYTRPASPAPAKAPPALGVDEHMISHQLRAFLLCPWDGAERRQHLP